MSRWLRSIMSISKPQEDAYGRELWDTYKGIDSIEVVERDDGYIDPSRVLPKQYFSSFDEWDPIEKTTMDQVKGKTLDIGCGAGRHSLYLQEKGFDVVGVDNSPLAIEVCRLRGLKNAVLVPIEKKYR
jgi:2-polyprenyl-3-methyl-5-hydroxy-6-metoxy-1,4-benzoquinol methylase